VLIENRGQGGSLNHLGVEVADTGEVSGAQQRVHEAGLVTTEQRAATCCYADQEKFWVHGAPGGERWEIYTVLADSPAPCTVGDCCAVDSAPDALADALPGSAACC
jgi:hypothetical protein